MTLTAWTSLAGASSSRQSGTITGAGSTFLLPLVSTWHAADKLLDRLQRIGSGGGIAAIIGRTVDFGASDAPMTPAQFKACKGCVQIPWAFSATSIPYNVPGLSDRIRLTGHVLAGIFGGTIKYWDTPAIKKLNPGTTCRT